MNEIIIVELMNESEVKNYYDSFFKAFSSAILSLVLNESLNIESLFVQILQNYFYKFESVSVKFK